MAVMLREANEKFILVVYIAVVVLASVGLRSVRSNFTRGLVALALVFSAARVSRSAVLGRLHRAHAGGLLARRRSFDNRSEGPDILGSAEQSQRTGIDVLVPRKQSRRRALQQPDHLLDDFRGDGVFRRIGVW